MHVEFLMEDKLDLDIIVQSINSLIKPEWKDLIKTVIKFLVLYPVGATEYIEQLSDVVCKTFSVLFSDKIKIFLAGIEDYYKEILIKNIAIFGELEWCCYNVPLKKKDIEITMKNIDESSLQNAILNFIKNNKGATVKEIDEYISKQFTRKIVKNIELELEDYLCEQDRIKLHQAIIDYMAKRYFDCANILAGLIDSQSIKQNLLDIENGKYLPDENGNQNVSQGWRAFYIVFKNNYVDYFDGESFNGNSRKESREKGFDDFIKNVKPNMLNNYEITIPFLHLSFCLLKFFDDSNWKNYPNNKPQVINRHWLMHGMYDIEDISKADCLKLLLMLNQLSKLYWDLGNVGTE